ncbi:hypothetical protein ACFC6L_16130 [Kitasatospora phosalacinea]|uniref:hypothetical protein n=1 Tax=Kitasatospora phosalacinea TaxID=2065 RepID=UPI0035E2F804
MKKTFRASVIGAAALMTLSLAVPGHAAGNGTVLTDSQVAALSADDQAARLNPLRALADAAAAVGREKYAGIYSGLEIDAGAGTVVIYLTDRSQAARFLAAAKAADGGADTTLARIKQGKHTRQAMHEARDRLIGAEGQLGYRIESISVPPDGSTLHLGVTQAEASKRSARSTAAVAGPRSAAELSGVETVETTTGATADASRYRDSPSWIAGEYITDNSKACTSGVPTRRVSDGRSILITAAHCFPDGASVYTGWENGGRNYIGKVSGRANTWDAIAIDTTGTGPTAGLEWDGPVSSSFVLSLTSSAYSYNGDYVCHDGYRSGVVCNIKVVADDITWTGENGVNHRGVQGRQVDGGTAVQGGDSGGLVFSITGSTRQARGIVSGGDKNNNSVMVWTEVTDVFNTFGLQLAPA